LVEMSRSTCRFIRNCQPALTIPVLLNPVMDAGSKLRYGKEQE
jgi:hypothetical protein